MVDQNLNLQSKGYLFIQGLLTYYQPSCLRRELLRSSLPVFVILNAQNDFKLLSIYGEIPFKYKRIICRSRFEIGITKNDVRLPIWLKYIRNIAS